MSNPSQIIDHFQERIAYCREQRAAYENWLGVLRPIRWAMILGSVILSGAAGLTVLSGEKYLGASWELYTALFSFGAGILTTLHSVLNCDVHQSECHRVMQSYEAMEKDYEEARVLDPDELKARAEKLQAELGTLIRNAGATPPRSFHGRAAVIPASSPSP